MSLLTKKSNIKIKSRKISLNGNPQYKNQIKIKLKNVLWNPGGSKYKRRFGTPNTDDYNEITPYEVNIPHQTKGYERSKKLRELINKQERMLNSTAYSSYKNDIEEDLKDNFCIRPSEVQINVEDSLVKNNKIDGIFIIT